MHTIFIQSLKVQWVQVQAKYTSFIHQHYLLRVTIWWVHFISTLYLTEHYQQFRDPIDPVCLTTCINITLYHVRIVKGWTIYQFLCVGSVHAHEGVVHGSWGGGGGGGTHQAEVCVICVMTSRDKVATWFTLYIMIHPVYYESPCTVPHNVSVMSAAPGLEPGWETLRPLP